ncbi:MAG: NADPH-dependent FMN reductase [Phycisphaerales bacterium]|nr:NADPH-dependent FMN reductase [Phycisphaerales bacterium]
MQYLVISSSRNPQSRSRDMARTCYAALQASVGDDAVSFLDAGVMNLPICDGDAAWSHPNAAAVKEAIEKADGIILSSGIYNYNTSAAAKNVIELGASAWSEKVVGLCCAAGGTASHMSPLSLIASLMLDFRCVIVPRYVYASGEHFSDDGNVDEPTAQRLSALAEDCVRMTSRLASHA